MVSNESGNICLDDPMRDARGDHRLRLAIDELEFARAAIAVPIEEFLDRHSRPSAVLRCNKRTPRYCIRKSVLAG